MKINLKLVLFSVSLFGLAFFNVASAQELTVEEIAEKIDPKKIEGWMTQSVTDTIVSNETGSPEVVLIATVGVYDFKLVDQIDNKLNLSFLVTNREKSQSNIKYGLNLLKIAEDGKEILVDEKIYPEIFDLSSNSEIKKSVNYEAPSYLKGKFGLRLTVKNNSGLILGIASLRDLSLNGDEKNIEIIGSSCFLTVKGEEPSRTYTLDQGVDVNFEENLVLNCEVKNNSNLDLDLKPSAKTFLRTTFGEEVNTDLANNEAMELKGFENRKIEIIIPKKSKPQAYDVRVSLENNAGVPSNFVIAHYVVRGKGATIQNLLLNKSSYQEAEKAEISFFYTKSADSFPNSRLGGSLIEGTVLKLNIKDGGGNACGKAVEENLDDSKMEYKIEYSIDKLCVSPLVQAAVIEKSSGNILTSSDFKFNSPEAEKQKVPIEIEKNKTFSFKELYIAIIGFLTIILLGLIIWRRKKSLLLFLLVFLSLSLFSEVKKAHADTQWVRYSMRAGNGAEFVAQGWSVHDFQLVYTLNKRSYSPGEMMTGEMWMTNIRCVNAVTLGHLQIQMPAGAQYTSMTNGASSLTAYKFAPTTPGNYTAIFHYTDLRYNETRYCPKCVWYDAIYFDTKARHLNNVGYRGIYPPNVGRTLWTAASTAQELSGYGFPNAWSHWNAHGRNEEIYGVTPYFNLSDFTGTPAVVFSIPFSVISACTPSCACSSYTNIGSTCSNGCGGFCAGTMPAISYSCQGGNPPQGANWCPGDDTGLTSNLSWINVGPAISGCTPTRKCEYFVVPFYPCPSLPSGGTWCPGEMGGVTGVSLPLTQAGSDSSSCRLETLCEYYVSCVPNCACATNTNIGSTCSNGCAGTCAGTKCVPSNACAGNTCTSLTCTDICGTVYNGTKACTVYCANCPDKAEACQDQCGLVSGGLGAELLDNNPTGRPCSCKEIDCGACGSSWQEVLPD